MWSGVSVKSYSKDNDIYTSKEFTRELHDNGQGIRHSGVLGHHHNGVSDNTINNVVRITRTMMIHSALSRPDASDKSLWRISMVHAVQLHNHNTHIYSGMSPE